MKTIHKTSAEMSGEQEEIASAQRDNRLFEPLYNRYFELVFRFIHKRVGDCDTTSDITSQVFLKALQNLSKFNNKGVPFSAWLLRIAINEMNDYFNRCKKSYLVSVESVDLAHLCDDCDVAEKEQQIEWLKKTLATLEKTELLMIELRFFENKSFKEIGDIMDITENNAKVKVYRIIDKMKQKLSANIKK